MITYDYPPEPVFGMGWNVYDLAKGLEKDGHSVKIVTTNRYGLINAEEAIFYECDRISKNLSKRRCTCSIFEKTCMDELFSKAKQVIGETNFEPQVIHCHGWMVFQVAENLSEEYDIPIVTTIHFLEAQYESTGKHPYEDEKDLILIKEKEMILNSTRLICVSDYGMNLFEKLYPPYINKASVVLHGVDIKSNIAQRKNEERKVLTFVGRTEPEKGIDVLCEAINEIPIDKYTEFNIVGSGTLLGELKKKYSHKFNFHGYVDRNQVYCIMLRSDFVIIPSLDEQFGLVALETMAAGAIPIVSYIGGLKQIVKSSNHGLLLKLRWIDGKPYLKKEELKEIVLQAISMEATRLSDIRDNNYAMIKKEFSSEIMVQNTTQIYKMAIK